MKDLRIAMKKKLAAAAASMPKAKLYAECDRVIGSHLAPHNFKRVDEGEYTRVDTIGLDRVMIDPEPMKVRFSVMMSYYPNDLNFILELQGADKEPPGFPVGPYLSPAGIWNRRSGWSYRTIEILHDSLAQVNTALDEIGLPWLQELRDPARFAQEVDPVAALYAGYAYEVAGDLVKAKERYENMMERVMGVLGFASEKVFLEKVGREFVFLSLKLGVDPERRERIQKLLDYYPEVKPIV